MPSLFDDENPNLFSEVESIIRNARAWLDTPNDQFNGGKPGDFIGTPEEQKLRDLLRAIKHGMVS